MKHNVFLQAIDDDGGIHTWKYENIKSFLVAENHIHEKEDYRFYKGEVNGIELEYSKDWPGLMRDVGDFKTYCRKRADKKRIEKEVPREILRKFILQESEEKKKMIHESVAKGESINDFYNNGGAGLCEYRPNYISGWNFHKSKGVEIEWINENVDVCIGIVTRAKILSEIKTLIGEGIYFDKEDTKGLNTLENQMTMFDFM